MKRLILMALALVIACAGAGAQNYKNSRYYNNQTGRLDYSHYNTSIETGLGASYYGLRIGPTFSTVSSDDENLDGGDSQTGLNIGVVAGWELSATTPLYFETGLYYIEKGGQKQVNHAKMTYDLNYLEVPLLLRYVIDLDNKFTIQPVAGGYLALGISGKIKNFGEREAASSFSEEYFQRFDGGLKLGCGVGYDLFYAELSYDIGLSNICHDTFDRSHNGCLILNFGVNF